MSVLIKGMDMPESCADCMVSAQRCGLWVGFKKKTKQRHPYCPLVEIPVPHGRLIDASKYEYPGDLKYEETVLESEGKDDG